MRVLRPIPRPAPHVDKDPTARDLKPWHARERDDFDDEPTRVRNAPAASTGAAPRRG